MCRALHLERNAKIKLLFLKFMLYSPLQVMHICMEHSINATVRIKFLF